MGLNKGYIKLTQGFTKTLTKSELDRGYIFLYKDLRVLGIIKPKVSVYYQGKTNTFTVDNFGRLHTGKKYISALPLSFKVKLLNNKLTITE